MYSQYFGNYLLDRGLITPDQLNEVLEFQRAEHSKLGTLAVKCGYMTEEQVENIVQQQMKKDKNFAEIAVEAGYLSQEQLDKLLSTQKQEHLMLGQAIVDKNYITSDQLQCALAEYRQEYGMLERQFNAFLQNETEEIAKTFFNYGETLWSRIYADYVSLMVRNFIRFIDDNPIIKINKIERSYNARWFVYQQIYGNVNMITAIAADDKVFLELSRRFAKKEFKEIDKESRASVGGFLNLNNAIFLVNMSNNGIELDMKPQDLCQNQALSGLKKGYKMVLTLPWGTVDIIIL